MAAQSGGRIDDARRLAESGDLDAAAEIFAELVADAGEADRAQAAVGLAVVLEERGDVAGARAAARTALATGHPEYASQAACHLARGFERESLPDQARAAWQAVIGLGTPAYMPAAHMALARIAADQGDDREAEAALRAALATADPVVGSRAAQGLAEYLLDLGEPGEAADILIEALGLPDVADSARLRVLLGIAHLDMACAEFAAAAETVRDTDGAALAIELLARTLPLRGRDDDAEAVWAYGLDHPDEGVAEQVRLRLHRDDGDPPGDDAAAPDGVPDAYHDPDRL
ncbi:tetratricopeptide repeat protein [Sphaerisporangium sp. TRM90804]|uniref:tetratricopeptide repeat protein n=1 Tax=Sphaerisporangium sp. TRM90804 TaxID=3031113 RepID=UPI0024481AB6|nr:tetratricopeptide repeat protein [Sphaerisporangium sp. TRM90804]MDH2426221.1 tetratricopeptide repeat protein [Sphaerisporangium sp. TRM90804]